MKTNSHAPRLQKTVKHLRIPSLRLFLLTPTLWWSAFGGWPWLFIGSAVRGKYEYYLTMPGYVEPSTSLSRQFSFNNLYRATSFTRFGLNIVQPSYYLKCKSAANVSLIPSSKETRSSGTSSQETSLAATVLSLLFVVVFSI